MRRLALVTFAALSFTIAGCRTETAIKDGAAVSQGKDPAQKADAPAVIEPSTEKTTPLKKVQ